MTHALPRPIIAWFCAGPWHLQKRTVDIDQHTLKTPKWQGSVEYRRFTQASGQHLISIFLAPGLTPEEQRAKIEEVSLRALEDIIRAETAAKAGAA